MWSGGENGGQAVEAQGLHRRCSLGVGSRWREDSSGGHKCHTGETEGQRGWQKQGALQQARVKVTILRAALRL